MSDFLELEKIVRAIREYLSKYKENPPYLTVSPSTREAIVRCLSDMDGTTVEHDPLLVLINGVTIIGLEALACP